MAEDAYVQMGLEASRLTLRQIGDLGEVCYGELL